MIPPLEVDEKKALISELRQQLKDEKSHAQVAVKRIQFLEYMQEQDDNNLWREFVTEDDKGFCDLCSNTGLVETRSKRKLPCICPNGRVRKKRRDATEKRNADKQAG